MISRSDDTDDPIGEIFPLFVLNLSMHGLLDKCDSSLIIYMHFKTYKLTSQSKNVITNFATCDVTNHWSHPQVEGQFMDISKIITITSLRCS